MTKHSDDTISTVVCRYGTLELTDRSTMLRHVTERRSVSRQSIDQRSSTEACAQSVSEAAAFYHDTLSSSLAQQQEIITLLHRQTSVVDRPTHA